MRYGAALPQLGDDLFLTDGGIETTLESPTWRANPGWAKEIGYSTDERDRMDRAAITLMAEIREAGYANFS